MTTMSFELNVQSDINKCVNAVLAGNRVVIHRVKNVTLLLGSSTDTLLAYGQVLI